MEYVVINVWTGKEYFVGIEKQCKEYMKKEGLIVDNIFKCLTREEIKKYI